MSRAARKWIWFACVPLLFLLCPFEPLQAAVVETQTLNERPLNTVRIHYHRPAADYSDWGLHLWGQDLDLPHRVNWQNPMLPVSRDSFGIYFDIPVKPSAEKFGFILHQRGTKDVQQDLFFNINLHGGEVWLLQGDPELHLVKPQVAPQQVPSGADKPKSQETFGGSSEAVELLRQLRSESVLENQRQADRISMLQSDLVAERLAREQAERLTEEARTLFNQTQQQYQQQLERADGVERQLLRSNQRAEAIQLELEQVNAALLEQQRRQTRDDTEWGWIAAVLSLAGMFCGSLLWSYRRNQLQLTRLKAFELENRDLSQSLEKEIDNHQQTEQRMTLLASYDDLTGLPNRAIFNQNLQHAVSQAKRYNKQVALLFIDLDRFKLINDTLGHDAGDMVLKTVTERFRACIREGDTLARLGGDEFLLLIEDLMDPKYVAGVAQKLLIAAQAPLHLQGQEYQVSASIGISTFPSDGKSAGVLLKNADVAMYRAKEQGKNNFQFFSEQMNIHSLQRLALESNLRHALKRDEFRLLFEPIVDTESMAVIGVESLLRWQHPDMGLVGPLQFIPIAEETGLIEELGLWVLEHACRQGRAWHDAGSKLHVNVNLSARQLASPTLLKDVRTTLRSTGFAPEYLTLEMTESTMMSNPEEVVLRLMALKELGVCIAIDDFGTGYSSLSHLKQFPIDILKVDRSFIQDVPGDQDDAALTAAIIALGRNLGLQVVAEGIEHESQRRFLTEHKCPLMQGYMICEPKTAHELEIFMRQRHLKSARDRKLLQFPG